MLNTKILRHRSLNIFSETISPGVHIFGVEHCIVNRYQYCSNYVSLGNILAKAQGHLLKSTELQIIDNFPISVLIQFSSILQLKATRFHFVCTPIPFLSRSDFFRFRHFAQTISTVSIILFRFNCFIYVLFEFVWCKNYFSVPTTYKNDSKTCVIMKKKILKTTRIYFDI